MATSPKNTLNHQTDYYRFYVHCLSTKQILNEKKSCTVNEIREDAFALFKQGNFNDRNAILTYLDDDEKQVLLTAVPDLLAENQYRDLFIKFV